jgi:hypothetical protein
MKKNCLINNITNGVGWTIHFFTISHLLDFWLLMTWCCALRIILLRELKSADAKVPKPKLNSRISWNFLGLFLRSKILLDLCCSTKGFFSSGILATQWQFRHRWFATADSFEISRKNFISKFRNIKTEKKEGGCELYSNFDFLNLFAGGKKRIVASRWASVE